MPPPPTRAAFQANQLDTDGRISSASDDARRQRGSVPDHAIAELRHRQAVQSIIGADPAFLRVVHQLPDLARGAAPILIEGETGTGKELIARALHYCSPRAGFPFIPINCGSLPDSLLEDELFGHERGAYTDARSRRAGLLAQANRGTLFLDEVDSLTPHAQVALLRVLQDKTFRALGSSIEQHSDVRFIAATNTSLDTLLRDGAMRPDLYYRLSVLAVRLPPLRERPGDIGLLAHHFLNKHALGNAPPPSLSEAAMTTLMAYEWPGNVRELENVIIRALHLCQGRMIEAVDVGLVPARGSASAGTTVLLRPLREMKREVIEAFERDYLLRLMAEHAGNVTRAARCAGKDRRELGKLLKKYHLDNKPWPRVAAPAWVQSDPPAYG